MTFADTRSRLSVQSRRPYRRGRSPGEGAGVGRVGTRIVVGDDEAALLRLWQEKGGRSSRRPLRQPHCPAWAVTKPLNRDWFERNTGRVLSDIQLHVQHPVVRWMAATLDGMVEATGAVFEASSCCRGRSRKKGRPKCMPQLQHNMWVTNAKLSVLSIITGGGKWVEISVAADPLYQHLLFTAERKFWRCVESGEPPRLFGVEPPRPRIETVRIVDMSASNSWAEFAGILRSTRGAFLEHEKAKTELKGLMPDDAKEAIGHGVRAKRSKSGAISFDLLEVEASHAALQRIDRRNCGGARQGTGRNYQSGKIADGNDPVPVSARRRPDVSLRAPFNRARHRAQGTWAA